MPISRYTQPIRAQYVPMDIKSYQTMKTAEVAGQAKPWNLIQSIRARQEHNYGNAVSQEQRIQENIAGIKGINQSDQNIVRERASYYNGLINDAIKKTGGSPGAMLPALNNINKEFRLDAIDGKLSQVSNRYKVGMEDLKTAKKDYSIGKLDRFGFELQKRLLGTGQMAPRVGQLTQNAKDILSKDFGTRDPYNNYDEIRRDYNKLMIGKYQGLLRYMSTPELRSFKNQIDAAFTMYYKNKGISGIPKTQIGTTSRNQTPNRDYNQESRNIYDNTGGLKAIAPTKLGKIYRTIASLSDLFATKVVQTDKNSNAKSDLNPDNAIAGLKFGAGLLHAGIFQNQNDVVKASLQYIKDTQTLKDKVGKINETAKKLDLPNSFTIKEKAKAAKTIFDAHAEKAETPVYVPDNKEHVQFSLLNKKGEFRDFTGSTVEVNTGSGYEKVQEKNANVAIRSLFGKTAADAVAIVKQQVNKGGLVLGGSRIAAGSVIYHLTDKKGRQIDLRITTNDPVVSQLMTPTWEASNAIDAGNIDKLVRTSGLGRSPNLQKDGSTKLESYPYFKIETITPSEDNRGNKLSWHQAAKGSKFIIVPYDNNKKPFKVKSTDGKDRTAYMNLFDLYNTELTQVFNHQLK